jgi:hypothetical protein
VSTPVRNAALAAANVTPIQHRLRLIRRLALAASVLLVAGISYRVGVSRTNGDVVVARESAPMARPAVRPEGGQGVAEAASKSAAEAAPQSTSAGVPSGIAIPASPEVRTAPRRVAQAEVDGVTGSAAQPVEPMAAPMAAPIAAPMAASASAPVARRSAVAVEDMASPAVVMRGGVQTTGSTLDGYQMREIATLTSVTRRRYVATDGTMLDLVITPATTETSKIGAAAVPAFAVSTAEGRSTVRWQRSGLSYELQGALAPDSLVTLATQLK